MFEELRTAVDLPMATVAQCLDALTSKGLIWSAPRQDQGTLDVGLTDVGRQRMSIYFSDALTGDAE
jgi:DNA-binding IclR family transcriptional regulator